MQNVTPAHTIVEIPEHISRVPAYYRSRVNPSQNFGVLPKKPESKVRIGATYQPAIRISPAVEIHVDHRPAAWWEYVSWSLGLVGFFVMMYLFGVLLTVQ